MEAASSRPPSPPAGGDSVPEWCGELDAEPVRAVMRVMGDAVVLKYSTSFAEHEQVARTARAHGIQTSEPFLIDSGAVFSNKSYRNVVVRGMAEPARLRPYLAEGSLALQAGDLALGQKLARELGVTLGDQVDVGFLAAPFAFSDDPQHRFGRGRVMALLAFPGDVVLIDYELQTVIGTLDWMRATLASDTPDNVTGLQLWFEPGVDQPGALEALRGELGGLYHVLGVDELNASAIEWMEALQEHCHAHR